MAGHAFETVPCQNFGSCAEYIADGHARLKQISIGVRSRLQANLGRQCIEKFQRVDICVSERIVVDERKIDRRAEEAAQNLIGKAASKV
ncbi:MAG: hypothetical protein H5U13_09460 [Parvibaculum sp.]|nr:hypothetical protein [Parvibaculum sp.]